MLVNNCTWLKAINNLKNTPKEIVKKELEILELREQIDEQKEQNLKNELEILELKEIVEG